MFYEDILGVVGRYSVGTKFTADTVRKDACLAHVPPPAHPNGWGYAVLFAGRKKLARRTGRYFPSDNPSSKGRRIAEWERI